MDLYARYIWKREKCHLIHGEKWFISYKMVGNKLFISNMYSEDGLKAIKLVKSIAKDCGCESVYGYISKRASNFDRILMAAKYAGFKLTDNDNKTIRAELWVTQ